MVQSLTPGFSMGNVLRRVDEFKDARIRMVILALAAVGDEAVNHCRHLRTYEDQTRHLRGSIGYVIAYDGEIQMENLQGNAGGKAAAKQVITEMVALNKEGFVLIVFAGMEYAAAVESKGYDVISSSVPLSDALLKMLKEGLNL